LSKDLYEDEPEFREAIEPDAQAFNDIRNHVEHKYLSAASSGCPAQSPEAVPAQGPAA
jgi:hypothetical protein